MKKNYLKIGLSVLAVLGLALYAHADQSSFSLSSGGSLQLGSDDTLSVTGDVSFDAGSAITGFGTLQTTGSFAVNNATVFFGTININSTTAQSISGSGSLTVANLITNVGGLTLGIPVTITSNSIFHGIVITTATNLLIYGNGASVGTVNNTAHVNGPVKYTGIGAFNFPVGDAANYRNVSTNLSTNSNGITATYHSADPVMAFIDSAFMGGLTDVSRSEYWDLSPTSTATGTVTINWSTPFSLLNGLITSISPLTVAHLTSGIWKNEGGAGNATGTVVTGKVTSTNIITTWSPFALGSSINNVLPVKFLGISAFMQPNGSRMVDWQVAQELNVANYSVQRSTDGSSFVDAGTVATANNGTTSTNYNYNDAANVLASTFYYRVRENAADGSKLYSGIAVVKQQANIKVTITPNPVIGKMTVKFSSSGNYHLVLINTIGQIIFTKNVSVSDNQILDVNKPVNALNGLYTIKLTKDDGAEFSQKILFR